MINSYGFKGYVSSNPINGSLIPQSLQNLKIRDYAKSKNLNFELSITEYNFKAKYFALNSLKHLEKTIRGIIFFSIYQLPENKQLRLKFLKFFLNKKKLIFFALEDIELRNLSQLKEIEVIFFITKNSSDKKKLKI